MTVKDAINILQQEGYKMTQRRKEILDFFAAEDKYKTAKDLFNHMEKKYPGISFDTVYRNLHLYDDLGILETTELNAEKHFRMKCGDHHHHHFICKSCGMTQKLNFCPMVQQVTEALAQFKIDEHKFEVYGECPVCLAS